MKAIQSSLKSLGNFFGVIATSIVSGLPRKKILTKPSNASVLQTRKVSFKPDSEKHYHRPVAKPFVEKQTLLKETKKPKAKH